MHNTVNADKKRQVILVVLDGWGYREDTRNNAIAKASTPCFDYLWKNNPHALLEASEEAVGLPSGQMGNSEIGHMTIGAGKVIDTDLLRINKSILSRKFHKNGVFSHLFEHVKRHNSTLHIKGLIGPGGIHSHSRHLFAFLEAAKENGIEKVAIHAFTDGRDTPPQSAHLHLREIEDVIEKLDIGFIATACGRFYAMDRDNNWDRIKKAEDALFNGIGEKHRSRKPSQIISDLHKKGILDEHLEPVIFLDENGESYQIEKNDGVFFFNFRSDRAKMLSIKTAERSKNDNLFFVTMVQYDNNIPSVVAFPPTSIETTLAQEISLNNLRQIHIAETEKFAHATYFLNGGKTELYPKEKHLLIESRKDIKTHDQAPQMRAAEITDNVIESIKANYDFIFVNFANPDMVGHTGNKKAIIESIEFLDKQLQRLVEAAAAHNSIVVITSDHGNAEENFDLKTDTPHTAHTTNKVPFIVVGEKQATRNGNLADVTPTILQLLDIKKPKTMTGKSLII